MNRRLLFDQYKRQDTSTNYFTVYRKTYSSFHNSAFLLARDHANAPKNNYAV